MELKIFTLNCWGLAVVSKNRRQRIQAIAEALAMSSYDVVCLQEVWIDSDFNLIQEKVSGVLPFSHYFYSGVTGSGVCVLSKHAIEEAFFHQWPVNGYIHKLHHGDWFGGKGVGLCKLTVNNFKINIYSAHLHAEYNRDSDEYQAHRVLQAFDTAQFIQLTSGGSDLVVLAGDLNTEPGDLAYRLILNVPGFVDAFTEAGDSAIDIAATNEALKNSYTPESLIKDNIAGKRIDYIMYHAGSNITVELKNYEHPLPTKVPSHSFSYSDHEAVAATFAISKDKQTHMSKGTNSKELALEESISVCDDALKSLANHKILYWFLTFVLFTLLVATIVTTAPFGYQIVYHILKLIITVFMSFTMIMATIWNKIERHAVIAGRIAMGVSLRKVRKSVT